MMSLNSSVREEVTKLRFRQMTDGSPGGICCISEHARKALNMCYREKTFHIRAIRSAIMVSVPHLPLDQKRRFK